MRIFRVEGLFLVAHNIECVRKLGEEAEVVMVSGRTYRIASKKLAKRLNDLSVPYWVRLLRKLVRSAVDTIQGILGFFK
jgi:hypothetical protein